jgi:hypothetical protein
MKNILNLNHQQCYVIIDAAKIKETTTELLIYEPENLILLQGEDAMMLEEVAPYLIKLEKDTVFTNWVLEEVYGNNAAIFIYSSYHIDTLSSHLMPYITTMIEIENPEGELVHTKAYMRIYDPRVLPNYIECLEEKEHFFMYIDTILCEDSKNTDKIYSYTYKDTLLKEMFTKEES